MDDGKWARHAPWTGVVAVALLFAGGAIAGDTPTIDASPNEVLGHYAGDESRTTAALVGAMGAFFYLCFAGVLRSALRRGEGETGGLSTLAFAGAVIAAAGLSLYAGLDYTLAETAEDLDPDSVQSLNALHGALGFPVAFGSAVFMLASGLSILRGESLPRWLGWAAVAIGAVALTPATFLAFLVSFAWIVAASVCLYRRPRITQ